MFSNKRADHEVALDLLISEQIARTRTADRRTDHLKEALSHLNALLGERLGLGKATDDELRTALKFCESSPNADVRILVGRIGMLSKSGD